MVKGGAKGPPADDGRAFRPTVERAVRAAIFVPLAFALGQVTGEPETGIFAAFGAFAILLLVELVGPPVLRLRAFLLMTLVGFVLVVLGTLCSKQAALAVPVAAALVFVILFFSTLSPRMVEADTATLLFLVLPLAVPAGPGEVGPRVAGVAIAAAVAIPAAMLVWPPRQYGQLRLAAAALCRAIAGRLGADGVRGLSGPEGPEAVRSAASELASTFERTATLPGGVSPSQHSLCALAGRLQWTGTQALRLDAGSASTAADLSGLRRSVVDVLGRCASILTAEVRHGRVAPEALGGLSSSSEELAERTEQGLAASLASLSSITASARDGAWKERVLGPSFRVRAVARTSLVVADDVRASAPPRERDLAARRRALVSFVRGARLRLGPYARRDSVWLRNSLRAAVAVSLAVLVVNLTDAQHGFWVVLGVLSVLRSSAASTGTDALRAVAGTVAGVAVGALVLWVLGVDPVALWLVLPVAVLVAGLAPLLGSLLAGQAAFTVVVIVLFNIVQPVGWQVGLIRIEDVVIGCLVAFGVGMVFWPRGGARLLGIHLHRSLSASSALLAAAVRRAVGGPSDLATARRQAIENGRLLDDAFRDYLLDRGAKPVGAHHVVTMVTGALQLRQAAESLALLVRSPVQAVDESPAIRDAGAEMARALADAARGYDELGTRLAGAPGGRPAWPPHPGLEATLAAGWEEARASGSSEPLRAMIQLLWAGEELADLEALRPTVVDAAERWLGGGRRLPRRPPHVAASPA